MWENLIDSLNVVLPMFLLMSFGYVLRIVKFLPESFYRDTEKFIFKIALPCQLFVNIAFADKSGGGEMYFDGELVRKDGLFVTEDLLCLNPDALK